MNVCLIWFFLFVIIVVSLFVNQENFTEVQPEQPPQPPKLAYITAIYGSYESSCKPFRPQSIPSDFICFTDNPNITANGWQVDATPYHIQTPSPLDTGDHKNSMRSNKHTFNIAKYYKQAFQNIPRLQNYDIIVWIDGTLEITNPDTSLFVYNSIKAGKNVLVFEHEYRSGILNDEVINSTYNLKYMSTNWNNQDQPYQDINSQYSSYINDGYSDSFWKTKFPQQPNAGVWITCFVAFDMRNPETRVFLDKWYTQTLVHTTQDQIGFPYALWKTSITPESLVGSQPHQNTQFYIKHEHGN